MTSPLSPQQRALVRHSFTFIAPNHDVVARLFYDKLFEIAPDLRSMFTHSLDIQRAKVMQMLASLVASMDDPPYFTRMAHELGKRHVGYGVLKEQYALLEQALMWALEEACPQVMTPSVVDAWTAAYRMIASTATEGIED